MRHFLMLSTVLLLLAVETATAAPKLEVPEAVFNFGTITQGDRVRHAFAFRNTGDQTLQIDRVRSSCGCTAALVSAKTLAPGEAGEVQANFDSTRFSGTVSKTIYLYSNDPVAPTKQLLVKGTIRQIVSISPTQVNFGLVSKDEPVQATVVLHNQGDRPLTLGPARSTARELVVEAPSGAFEPGAEMALTLRLTAKPGQKRFNGYVLVPVEGGPVKELRVPVYAAVKP